MSELTLALAQAGVIAVLGGIAAMFDKNAFRMRWFAGALALYVLYEFLLTRGFYTLPDPLPELHWNWAGKSLAIAGMLAIALLPAFGLARAGVTLRQTPGWRMALAVLALFTALFFWLAISGADGADDVETIAFQWTMPGFDEELFYRGVLLLAMNEAFTRRWRLLGAPIGIGGLLTSVLFGLAHAMDFEDGAITFDAMTFAMTGVPSLVLLWLRERTGSILMPVIAHNVANGAATLF